tara:strand:- start:7719 stop:7901 length:183 start_codon:yes stop_codon:yes gene_type:complete
MPIKDTELKKSSLTCCQINRKKLLKKKTSSLSALDAYEMKELLNMLLEEQKTTNTLLRRR